MAWWFKILVQPGEPETKLEPLLRSNYERGARERCFGVDRAANGGGRGEGGRGGEEEEYALWLRFWSGDR